MVDLRSVDFRSRKKTRPGENRRGHIEEIKPGQLRGDVEVRVKKRANRPDVLPVPLEHVRAYAHRLDGVWDDMFAEIRKRVVQQFANNIPVKNVNAHRRQEQLARIRDLEFLIPIALQAERVLNRGIFRLLHKSCYPSILIHL